MDLLSLGSLHASDFLAPDEEPRAEPFELRLVMDEDTRLVHLAEQPPPELLWGSYWYRSGTNAAMRRALGQIVSDVRGVAALEDEDVWVDIACNDGTLLSMVPPNLTRVGVDPADDSFAEPARAETDLHLQEPFTRSSADAIIERYGYAKVVTCVAMLYDLADPSDFLSAVRYLLSPDGLLVLQLSYTPLMLHQVAFDNVVHEHACYYTLRTLQGTLEAAGFQVLDVELNDVNGGSFRLYVARSDANVTRVLGAQPRRDVGRVRIEALTTHEEATGVNEPDAWHVLWERVLQLRTDARALLERIRVEGKVVWGYGASTKGNTLLQFFNLDHTLIEAIADAQSQKWGRRTVGTNIPITSEEDMRVAHPDYLLVLPWHFITEFRQREAKYLVAGGMLIVPCPRLEVIGAQGPLP